jgi:hypothetical protein
MGLNRMKLINLLLIALFSLFFIGCSSTTYKSEGTVFIGDNSSYKYAFINNLAGSAGETNVESTKYDIKINKENELNYGGVDNLIIGTLLKQGISIITEEDFALMKESKSGAILSVEWTVSGRQDRGFGSYSQEVVVIVKDAQTGVLIYKGVGEGMGMAEEDDIRIALLAALKRLKL